MLRWKIKERRWYILNHLYGWALPLTLSLTVYVSQLTENGLHPGFGEKSCWFAGKYMFCYFLLI